jgi:hypothetical protein
VEVQFKTWNGANHQDAAVRTESSGSFVAARKSSPCRYSICTRRQTTMRQSAVPATSDVRPATDLTQAKKKRRINRYTKLLESLVSYTKQRTAAPINRHTFRTEPAAVRQSNAPRVPSSPFSLFTFPISNRKAFPSHSPLANFHCISNRKPEILESHLTPALSINDTVLIANFEPFSTPLLTPSHLVPRTRVEYAFPAGRFACQT